MIDISAMLKDELINHKEKLGKRIAQFREEKEYGVRQFALLCDIEHHQLINIEKGRVDPRYSTLLKISKGLGIHVSDLLNF